MYSAYLSRVLVFDRPCGLSMCVCLSADINRLFPNFNAFIKVVLKKERLSEEAELNRARYEAIIKAMEEGHLPPRPVSLIGDDDSGYHSTKPKGTCILLTSSLFSCNVQLVVCVCTSSEHALHVHTYV